MAVKFYQLFANSLRWKFEKEENYQNDRSFDKREEERKKKA